MDSTCNHCPPWYVQKYNTLTKTATYKAAPYIVDVASQANYLANLALAAPPPPPPPSFGSPSLVNLAMIIANKAYTFYKLTTITKIPSKIDEQARLEHKARQSKDATEIIKSDLKSCEISVLYLKSVQILHDCFDAVGAVVSPLFTLAAKVCNALALFVSTSELLHTYYSCKSTDNFKEKLDKERHIAFLRTYQKTKHFQTSNKKELLHKNLYKLSLDKLKRKTKTIKRNLKSSNKHPEKNIDTLNKLKDVANRTFINNVMKRVDRDVEIAREHFGVSLDEGNNLDELKIQIPDAPKHLFSSLNTPAVMDDSKQLKATVKLLKSRMTTVNNWRKFSYFPSIFKLLSGAVGIITSFGVTAPAAPPISAGLGLFSSFLTAIHIYKTSERREEFIENMNTLAQSKKSTI